jgi:hypothetical protein
MTEEDSAEVLKDVFERHPPPNDYGPFMFGCFVALLNLAPDEQAIEEFADKCGLTVFVKVVKLDAPDKPKAA